jgi:hypothetical protein
MLAPPFALAVLLAVPLVVAGPAAHYAPKVGDGLRFAETIAVSDGYGNYSGYTESDAIVGALNVTAVLPNGTETARYNYSGTYTNSTGADYRWDSNGTFTFSASTFRYVSGTDNQSGDQGTNVWFYVNNSTAVGATVALLGTPTAVRSLDATFNDTATGRSIRSILTVGTGTYVRDDAYGDFNASYDWSSYFDPSTGYVVGYSYVEEDANGRGDGFVYTDDLAVTQTSYPLDVVPAAPTYAVTVAQSGLPTGRAWSATFDGVEYTGSGPTIAIGRFPNGTYLFSASASGYAVAPAASWLEVSGGAARGSVQFTAASSGGASDPWLWVAVALVVLVVVVVLVIALARRGHAAHPLPRHSAGGQVRYGPPPPPGPSPPPISLRPADQPQIQQVVVKEVVKVNCRYCGSLIDSTAEKCPFCGASRT